jgi:pSer/pThr/pTyr-binding forkhead associated (FHA) protein
MLSRKKNVINEVYLSRRHALVTRVSILTKIYVDPGVDLVASD